MSYEAKASFLNKVEKELSTQITVSDMNNVLRILADVLQGFRMEELITSQGMQDDLLQIFLDALQVQGRSPKTIAHYKRTISKLMESLGIPTRQVTVYHLRNWIAKEQARGIANRTVKGNREVFSAFFGWLFRERLIERNPVDNLGVIKCAKKKKKIFTAVDIEKLNEKCSELKYTLRNRAIIQFLKSTGCRISETIELNRDQVNLEKLELVVHGKGDKERKVYLDEVAGMLLKEYLESRKDDNEALFVSSRRTRLTPNGIRAMLKRLAKKAAVENVHPHKFRRTLGTNLNRRGMPIQEVAAILGHEKLDTTMEYLVLNDADLKNDYRKFT